MATPSLSRSAMAVGARLASRRSYATHAPAFSVTQASGVRVAASSDEGKPTSAISVIVKAGSRYEPAPGMSHVLKNLVFKVPAIGARSRSWA